LVRRVDEDRWLASRFAPRVVRERLAALYALNHEIARVAEAVSEATLGEMRLLWWREAVEEIFAGKAARGHPALQAFAGVVRGCALPQGAFSALIEAREKDIAPAPFASWDDVEAYVDSSSGGLMRLACAVCSPEPPGAQLIEAAGRAWGYAGLARVEAHWRHRGRRLSPLAHEGAPTAMLIERARAAHEEVRALGAAPSALIPALAHVALVPMYLRRIERAEALEAPLLARQWRLIGAAASGRL
jgi:phytoene synthase